MNIVPEVEIHIFQRGKDFTNFNDNSKRKINLELQSKKIHLHLNEEIRKVFGKFKMNIIVLQTGESISI